MSGSAGIAWITGASSGIGRALALEMAGQGWQVAASARSAERLATLQAHAPGVIHAFALDVTDAGACRTVAQRIAEELGPIDLAVFNAGVASRFSVKDFDADAINAKMTVNYGGTVNGIAAVLPAMLARGAGHIAMTASVAGFRGLPGSAPYAASKAAQIALAESLHLDLAHRGITVSVITPGYVRTPLTADNNAPMPFLVDVEDAARIIRRGLEQKRFEITFPRRLSWTLKLLQRLPYAAYFPLIRRLTGK